MVVKKGLTAIAVTGVALASLSVPASAVTVEAMKSVTREECVRGGGDVVTSLDGNLGCRGGEYDGRRVEN